MKFLPTLSNREIYMIGHGNLEKRNKSTIVQKMWHIEYDARELEKTKTSVTTSHLLAKKYNM